MCIFHTLYSGKWVTDDFHLDWDPCVTVSPLFIFYTKILFPEKIHQAHGAAQKAKKSLQKPKAQKSVSTKYQI